MKALGTTTRRAAAILLLSLLAAMPAAARVVVLPSGRLVLVEAGRLVLVGSDPAPPVVGWLNATMTSNIAPSPNVASSAGPATINNPWQAFDHDDGTYPSISMDGSNASGALIFDFGAGNTSTVTKVMLKQHSGGPSYGIVNFTIEASNDGLAYAVIHSDSAADTSSYQEFAFTNGTGYRYWMLRWSSALNAFTVRIYEIQLWGSQP